jgi:hypothetical protein
MKPCPRFCSSGLFRPGLLAVCLTLTVAGMPHARAADDEAGKRRLEFMQAAIADLQVTSKEIDSDASLQFAPQPLLRYSDPTRDLMDPAASVLADAGVWRLGREGRPTALVVLENYRSGNGSAVMAYEFISLAPEKFTVQLKSRSDVGWEATGTEMKPAPLPNAPRPAESGAARLAQMRQLARRFTVREELSGNQIECRLLPQPIDRYQTTNGKSLAGAIFAFANGTNPEAGVILECDGQTWSYGVFRLGAAALTVQLDGRQVAAFPFFGEYGRRDGAYTSTSHAIPLAE